VQGIDEMMRRIAAAACGLVLSLAWTCAALEPSVAAAQQPPAGALAQAAEPTSPRVGKVRRNAQGVIELVPDAPSGGAAAPAAALQPAPKTLPAAPQVVSPPTRAGGGTPAPAPEPRVPAAAAVARASCEPGVLLCMSAVSTADEEQRQVPITFGHPLAAGLLPAGQSVVARVGNASVPVQLDQVSRHHDGSVRFAAFSLVLPRLGGRETAKLELLRGAAAATAQPAPIPAAPVDLKLELDTYTPQVTEITFGDRVAEKPGIPFKLGETITLAIGEPAETYTLTVTPEMAGGSHSAYTAIAKAFVPLMARSRLYRAHRDAPEVYETLWITSREAPGNAFKVRVGYGGAAKIAVTEVQKWAPRQRYVATLPAAPAGGTVWLDGPVAREVYLPLPLRNEADGREHPALSVHVGVRRYAGFDGARLDVTVDNTAAVVDVMRNCSYDATVRAGGSILFERKGIEHYAAARWHKLVWAGKAPQLDVVHDRARMLDSRALPPYDQSLRVSDGAVAGDFAALRRADTGPMGPAFIYPRMPSTGGRPDIGPLPRWAALHALTQDPRQARVVLANGDASGSMPMHFRDQRTGLPVNVKHFPNGRYYDGTLNLGDRKVRFGWAQTPYQVDTAHQPSLAYYPYLLTGDRFYLDELHYWASFNAFAMREKTRGGTQGLIQEDQVRAQAWSLRTLAHAAWATADQHPLKAVFQEQLKANMDWYVKTYVAAAPAGGGTVLQIIADPYHGDQVAPWQQDFMAIVVAHLAENDVDGADKLARWMARFVVGRWTAESQGYCRALGPGYWLKFVDPKTGATAKTWAEFSRAAWPDVKSCAGVPWAESWADCAGCYTSGARAALASFLNLGIKEAAEPYDFIRLHTPNSRANFAGDPTFALAPRRP
jgi:hypothetical protein